MRLDKNQTKAVNHVTGPAIVVAGPGSGKTTVIAERILNLIRVHNVPPEKILAIAFNRKAVEEMESRILAGLGKNSCAHGALLPEIRTLHAFGKDIIIENYRYAGFAQEPQIWSGHLGRMIVTERNRLEQEASTTTVAIYKIESKTTGRCYIGQSVAPERREREHFSYSSNDRLRQAIRAEGVSGFSFEVLEWVLGADANRREAYWIGVYKNQCSVFNRADPLRERFSSQVMLEMFCQHFGIPYEVHLDRHPDFENLFERFDAIQSEVMRAKRQVKTGLFDPKTLENRVVQAFAEKYEAAKTEANAIDFEDMLIHSANLFERCPDICQTYCERYPYLLVDEFQDISPADFRLISRLSENLFAVGDDDQAIYGFRGGNSQIMLEFASRRDVSKYEITRNYRSTSTLVEHARTLIERNLPRIKKDLRAHNPVRGCISIVEATPERLEELLLVELATRQETAVLARTNYEVDVLEKMLSGRHAEHRLSEITTIHKAKGREYEKVILIHNALGRHFPRGDSDRTEERRVLYVAMTRAKLELVVLGGDCPFIPEFEKVRKNLGYYSRQFGYWYARRKLNQKELDSANKMSGH